MVSVSSNNLCNKSLTSSASATIIGNNSNLLIDILYWLPLKTLGVFKSVSKQWQSLISDPSFERNYNLRSHRLSKLALLMDRQLYDFEILVIDERKDMDFVPFKIPCIVNDTTLYKDLTITLEQSRNGLLLFKVDDYYDDSLTLYVIYNPSMKHCKTLPSLPFRKTGDRYVLSATIAFDPAKSSYYQVVGVMQVVDGWIDEQNVYHMFYIEIYSSKTDSWRYVAVGDPCPFSAEIYCHYGVYWNGSVHWIDVSSAILYYFDIGCELIKKIAMPTDPKEDFSRQIVYFNECRGHMHLMRMRKDDMPRFDIWEMLMDHTGWNLKYHVDLTPLTTIYPGIVLDRVFSSRRFSMDVLLIEEGEDSSRLILWILKGKAISFDLKNKSFKEIYDANGKARVEGFPYMETLAYD